MTSGERLNRPEGCECPLGWPVKGVCKCAVYRHTGDCNLHDRHIHSAAGLRELAGVLDDALTNHPEAAAIMRYVLAESFNE